MEVCSLVEDVAHSVRRALHPKALRQRADLHPAGDAADIVHHETQHIGRSPLDVFVVVVDGEEELSDNHRHFEGSAQLQLARDNSSLLVFTLNASPTLWHSLAQAPSYQHVASIGVPRYLEKQAQRRAEIPVSC